MLAFAKILFVTFLVAEMDSVSAFDTSTFPSPTTANSICYELGGVDKVTFSYPAEAVELAYYFTDNREKYKRMQMCGNSPFSPTLMYSWYAWHDDIETGNEIEDYFGVPNPTKAEFCRDPVSFATDLDGELVEFQAWIDAEDIEGLTFFSFDGT